MLGNYYIIKRYVSTNVIMQYFWKISRNIPWKIILINYEYLFLLATKALKQILYKPEKNYYKNSLYRL